MNKLGMVAVVVVDGDDDDAVVAVEKASQNLASFDVSVARLIWRWRRKGSGVMTVTHVQ